MDGKTWKEAAEILLPIAIFLVLVSIRPAVASVNTDAEVFVIPDAALDCMPDPFVAGQPKEKTVTCYVEMPNFDVAKIITGSVRLSISGYQFTPIPILSSSTGDYDGDGEPDLKVTFSKSSVNSWFSYLYMPLVLDFKVTGEARDLPTGYVFEATDGVQVIKPSYTFVRFYAEGGQVTAIKGIDMNTARVQKSSIDESAHQLIRLAEKGYVNVWTDIIGTVTGTIPVHILPGMAVDFGFTAWVKYENGQCTFLPYSYLACDGTGTFYKRGMAVGYSYEPVSIHFETDGATASMTAKRGDKIVFEQVGVPVENFKFKVDTTMQMLFSR